MEKLLKLKQARAAALAKAEAADKASQQTEFDAAMADVDRLDGEIKTAQDEQDAAATAAAAATGRVDRLATARRSSGPRTLQRQATASPDAPRSSGQRLAAEADDQMHGFRTSREFFSAVMAHALTGRADERLATLRAHAEPRSTAGSDEQGEYSQPYGGFLVPAGMSPTLLAVGAEADPTVGRTLAIPMDVPSLSINARTDKDHTTSVVGGLTFSRRGETQEASSSRQKYEQVILRATTLTGVNYQSNELINDSPTSIAALIEAGFRTQYGAHMLKEKIRGTGAGEYEGVLNSPALVTVAAEGGQAADTIVYANVTKMRARCWNYGQAVWLANHDTFPQLAQMSLAVGTGGAAVWMPSAVEDRPDMLLGRPIFFTEFASAIGDVGDLILCNWSQYLEGTLQGLVSSESIHVRFLANENTFKIETRNDGRGWWRSALTPNKGANSLSPFVTLAAR
jgi:HK97 family phage major capsid protein